MENYTIFDFTGMVLITICSVGALGGFGWLVYLGVKLVRKGLKYDFDYNQRTVDYEWKIQDLKGEIQSKDIKIRFLRGENDRILNDLKHQREFKASWEELAEKRFHTIRDSEKKPISTQKDLGMLRCEFEDNTDDNVFIEVKGILKENIRLEKGLDQASRHYDLSIYRESELREVNKNLKEDNKRLEQSRVCRELEYQDLEAKYKHCRDQCEKLKENEYIGTSKEVQTLKEENERIINLLSYWKCRYEEDREEIAELKNEIKEQKDVCSQCNEDDYYLNEEIEELRKDNKELKERISWFTVESAKITDTVKSLSSENEHLKDRIEDIEECKEIQTDTILVYDKKITQLLKENEELRDRNLYLSNKMSEQVEVKCKCMYPEVRVSDRKCTKCCKEFRG